MASGNQVVHVAASVGPTLLGPSETLKILITGVETGGELLMVETTVEPGGGTPPHIHHREDESFYVLEGSLTLNVGDKTMEATAGDFIRLPRDLAHWFQNTSQEPAKVLITITPAGLEKFFEEVYVAAVPGAKAPEMGPAMIAKFLAAAPKAGLEILVPGQ
jgi:quercetin dioxygenase-like cupin family protein